MTPPRPDDLDDSAVSLLLLSNLSALLAAAATGLAGFGLASAVGVGGGSGWEALERVVLFGFWPGVIAYLIVLGWCVNRWITRGRGLITALATIVGVVVAIAATSAVLGSLDDGQGSEDVVVGWLAVILVGVVQARAALVLRTRVASGAGVAILSLMVVAGVAL